MAVTYSGDAATTRTNLGLGSLATKSAVGAAEITDNSVGAAELNVSGNGTAGQTLISDGDGSFSWTSAGSFTTLNTTGSVVFNEAGGDVDFRVESDTNDHAFFLEGSSGNVGIGTSSPAGNVGTERTSGSAGWAYHVKTTGVSNDSGIYMTSSNTFELVLRDASSNLSLITNDSNNLVFHTAGTERMRIDSSGFLKSGNINSDPIANNQAGYSISSTARRFHSTSGEAALAVGTSSATLTAFFYHNGSSGSNVGNISTNGTSTAYNTTSDYRLKEDWQPMTGSIDRLKALNPVNFAWKADGSRVDGFLAHEAAEVVPEAVSGEKDAVEAIGNITDAEGTVVQENVTEPEELSEGQTWTKTEDRPVYQGIDQAKLVPLLTAALQEAVSKIEALETRIAALEA